MAALLIRSAKLAVPAVGEMPLISVPRSVGGAPGAPTTRAGIVSGAVVK